MLNVEIGKGLTIEVDGEALREHAPVWNHVVYIGLRNILMDAHASAKAGDFESPEEYRKASLTMAQKKLDAMTRGELRTTQSGPRASHVDPVAAEALRLARTFVYGRARGWEKGADSALQYIDAVASALGLAKSDRKAVLNAAIAKRAARDDVQKTARDNVESAKAIAVNVDDLGI